MTRILEYSEGEWYLVAGAVVSCLTPDAGLARQIWPAVAAGQSLAAVLTELLATGLVNLPDLALYETTACDVRVLLRGDVSSSVVLADGSERSGSGLGVATWSEYAFSEARSGSVGRSGTTTLPLGLGVVRASGFVFTLGPDESDVRTPIAPVRASVTKPPVTTPPVAKPAVTPSAVSKAAVGTTPVSTPAVGKPAVVTPAVITPVAPATEPEMEPVPVLEPAVAEPTPVVVPDPVPVSSTLPVPPPLPLIPSTPSAPPAPSVLTATNGFVTVPPDSSPVRPNLAETRAEAPDTSFSHLFESTILRSVEDAAVRDIDPVDGPPSGMISTVPTVSAPPDPDSPHLPQSAGSAARLGDHDGSTIMAGQLAALRATTAATAPTAAPAPLVLVLRDGQRLTVDRPVVFGRRPQADRVSGADLPQLITVSSPNQDISRNHLQVSLAGAEVVARDLHATNGSLLRRVGGDVVEIVNGSEVVVVAGDELDLGDGVVVRLEAR